MDINETGLGVSAHRAVGAGVNTRRHLTVAAMEREIVPFHVNSGHRLRFLVNGIIKFLPLRANLNPTPEITRVALRTFFWIYLDYFHLTLLNRALKNYFTLS
jgi:hypothetical protein